MPAAAAAAAARDHDSVVQRAAALPYVALAAATAAGVLGDPCVAPTVESAGAGFEIVLRRNPFAAHDDGKRFARRHVDRRLDFSAVAAIIEAIVCFARAALRSSSVDPHLRHACRNDERLRAAGEIDDGLDDGG